MVVLFCGMLGAEAAAADPAWTDVATAIASMVGAAGLVGVFIQIRQTRLGREGEISLDISRRWDEPPVRHARELTETFDGNPVEFAECLKVLKKYVHEKYLDAMAEANFYEDIGVMCGRGVMDEKAIRESLGETLYKRWLTWKPTAEWKRETDRANYEHFEALALAMSENNGHMRFGRRMSVRAELKHLRRARAKSTP
jgi:hypothetical protein